MDKLVVLGVFAAVGLGEGLAKAESAVAQVERLSAEAVALYKGADYRGALELLQRAYEIRQVPALLFNLAKAYDRLGEIDRAIEAFGRYADSADADPALKARAELRLMALEEARRKRVEAPRPLEPRAEPHRPQSTPKPPPVPVRVEPVSVAPPLPTDAEQIQERRRRQREFVRRRDRYLALGIGVGALSLGAVGLGLSISASEIQSQWSQMYGGDEELRRGQKQDALVRAGVGDGFFGLAAAAAGVTAYYLYRGFHSEPRARSVALVPVLSPAGVGLVAGGGF